MRYIPYPFVIAILCYGFAINPLSVAHSFPLLPLAEKNLQEVIFENDSNKF
jgi:hypothetical protein